MRDRSRLLLSSESACCSAFAAPTAHCVGIALATCSPATALLAGHGGRRLGTLAQLIMRAWVYLLRLRLAANLAGYRASQRALVPLASRQASERASEQQVCWRARRQAALAGWPARKRSGSGGRHSSGADAATRSDKPSPKVGRDRYRARSPTSAIAAPDCTRADEGGAVFEGEGGAAPYRILVSGYLRRTMSGWRHGRWQIKVNCQMNHLSPNNRASNKRD